MDSSEQAPMAPAPSGVALEGAPVDPSSGRARRIRRRIVRFTGRIMLVPILYFACTLVGLIPVNNDFESAESGVTIYVASSAVHSDVILPVVSDTVDWRYYFKAEHFRAPRSPSHVAIGWGDRGFYLDTPTWSDLKASTAFKAMCLPSATVMHAEFLSPRDSYTSVKITAEQYQRLVDFIRGSFVLDEAGRFQPIDNSRAYGRYDCFYEARGRYHAFNTCNCWTGRALKRTGVRVGWFTPLPGSVLWYLPASNPGKK